MKTMFIGVIIVAIIALVALVAVVLLYSMIIPSMASYDCARNFDLMTELQNA